MFKVETVGTFSTCYNIGYIAPVLLICCDENQTENESCSEENCLRSWTSSLDFKRKMRHNSNKCDWTCRRGRPYVTEISLLVLCRVIYYITLANARNSAAKKHKACCLCRKPPSVTLGYLSHIARDYNSTAKKQKAWCLWRKPPSVMSVGLSVVSHIADDRNSAAKKRKRS